MATGPDHYLEAERLARLAALDQEMDQGDRLIHLRAAQVHATLAHAAATAMNGYDETGMHKNDYNAWDTVCGVPLEDTQENGREP